MRFIAIPNQLRTWPMKQLILACAAALLISPAYAQSTSSSNSQNSQATQNPSSQTQNTAAAQKLKQTLESEGFTDVKVVARSFVVQGKSPDGDPVVMTIGPRGMSVFEAMNSSGSGQTTGSSNQSATGSNSSTPAPANPTPKTQK